MTRDAGRTPDSARRTTRLLTGAELAVLAALEDLIEECGYPPTESQLRVRLGWRSRSAVHVYLNRLRAKDVIAGVGRALRVLD